MRDKHRITVFYIEMLLLVAVFTGVILVLSNVFATAKEQSSNAKSLNGAVQLAENAAEIVGGTDDHSEMVDLLGGDNNAACHLESQKLLARYNGDMEPDPDGGFLVVITWEDIEGLTNYDITVTWREDPIYELETSVFYE
ncbi:hypothetical protein I5Q82_19185 [Acutalibacter muris]|jgi:hypothetical protein|uniref:Prepilin-type cleavage/methylation domain-containing protein n=1 Tax=Acutalibacter muris TaxID=1796620 RepID=A0A1Z2XQS9_9FIRM|nr:hypothetical protein [Acutalibacter muris]ANU55950.1 hypothetical protein A4V00_19120 [Hungateiclostridiaceae bacterium KB18]ASB40802.1 hypothetical protein ADH66_09145 [Acutalibacter muris]MCI9543914.1 hypothetical protein [Acutalibacter muris]QQR30084.1 hypothetical protein I5Q82_19185 [Acutalibacter muris]